MSPLKKPKVKFGSFRIIHAHIARFVEVVLLGKVQKTKMIEDY